MKKNYQEVHGTWQVTTEGDVEGRTIKHLGTFTGYVDEIALYLANKCYYSLKFKKIDPIDTYNPSKTEVHVSFDYDSDTWDSIKTDKGMEQIRKVFRDRPVNIQESNYYASFKIAMPDTSDYDRSEALAKLTEKDKRALGLI